MPGDERAEYNTLALPKPITLQMRRAKSLARIGLREVIAFAAWPQCLATLLKGLLEGRTLAE